MMSGVARYKKLRSRKILGKSGILRFFLAFCLQYQRLSEARSYREFARIFAQIADAEQTTPKTSEKSAIDVIITHY
jgi:hypothetical protein